MNQITEEREKANAEDISSGAALFFILLHIPLALLFKQNTIFPTLHALASLGLGLLWLASDRAPKRIILMIAYITGAELLWRGTNASLFYEFGKYAVILLLFLAILKFRALLKSSKWSIWYFLLLTPSILVMPSFDREAISYNLAGPLALAIAVVFFSVQTITPNQLRGILIALLAPAAGLGGLAFLGIATADTLKFVAASSFQTAADIGPNQVSAVLSLGSLAAFYYALIERKIFYRYVFIGLSLWLLAQAALTFSRGGIWTTLGAAFISGFYLLRDRRTRAGFIFAGILLALLSYFVVIPFLDNFSNNTLSARFSSLDSTGRYEIIQADLMIFKKFPVFGVGPNQSRPYHALTFRISNAHTEYSRMLSEHGSFGLLALIILAAASLRRFFMNAPPLSKAFITGMTAWTLLYMIHAATRLVAPSFLFGLAAATFTFAENAALQKDTVPRRR
ncbi:MAG: O-antigen ligase family protein [Anaerolineales bacterium]|nr:O-antigen ligase family protein [Anaerolineales bacterium]